MQKCGATLQGRAPPHEAKASHYVHNSPSPSYLKRGIVYHRKARG
jgi:hypothetical protein